MDALKNPITTYKIAQFPENRVFAFWRQTNKQMGHHRCVKPQLAIASCGLKSKLLS